MLKIYDCIATAHDLRLVVLAAFICTLSSFAATRLLHHARSAQNRMRVVWLGVAAVAIGFGIWATHFIAMLAFTPGVPSGYNIILTFISLLAAILLTGIGFGVAITNWRGGPWIGGAFVAGGIAAMHYTGMAAFEIAGNLEWDRNLVALSIVAGAALGAAALAIALHRASGWWQATGAILLTLAVCSHHFTAMAAVSIIPDPTRSVSPTALPTTLLAALVCVASFVIILLALGAVALDVRERQRTEREADRMHGLANAAVEGLVVCDGDLVVAVNESFATLIGQPAAVLVGTSVSSWLTDDTAHASLFAKSNQPLETNLRHRDGSLIPAELMRRQIDYAGRPAQVIAVRDLRARRKNEQHIRYLAHHDALTSLPNRNYFHSRLDEEIAHRPHDKKIAVLCMDLDRFKEINDLFGHATGDKVLQTVARRVGGLLDENHMMARLGGDEFAIMLTNLSETDTARHFAEQVLSALRVKGDTPDTDSISCSMGIAICPDDATDREMIFTHADTALYRVKTEGRSGYRFFETKMGHEVRERRRIEHDLRHAIERDQLQLAYQPQQEVQTGQVTGFEALLRWHHPERGNISPVVFIPIAEEAGLIATIGEWVLRQACYEAASWTQPLMVAVNVSPMQIYDANFAQTVHAILLETGLEPHRLELEITETALIRELNRALLTLRQIKALGVQIAMDDFGTGYSSLSNLRAFPFDKIKIDGSFIKSVDRNDQAATIVRTVLALGRGLGLPVLAEGVETDAELQFLRDQNCDGIQGFLIGRPASIGQFRELTHGSTHGSAQNRAGSPSRIAKAG